MPETVKLSDPECPLRIEYSTAAMEQIRQRARAGLMAAPRVGMGVGGLLLGVKDASGVHILDSIEIPCSHSAGPSFTLTPEERRESIAMVAEANALSASSRVSVVGWYCSKTRGGAILSDSDRSFFDELLPGAGQLAVVLRPDVFESMRAAFFYRDRNGAVVKGMECELDEWLAAPPVEADANALELAEESPKVVEIRQPAPKAAEPEPPAAPPVPLASPVKAAPKPGSETRLEDIIGLSAEAPAARLPASPAYFSPALVAPGFAMQQSRAGGRLTLIFSAAVAVIVLAIVAFITRDSWLPRPPLNLTFSELNGSLLIHWDPESLRGIDHASMYVNDGGQSTPSVIPLDRFELTSGQLSYTPKTNHITAKLDAGYTSAFSTWVAEEKPAGENPAEQKPALESPAPESKPAADPTPPAGRK